MSHHQFPSRLPDLAPSRRPTTLPSLCAFVSDPGSPFVRALAEGFPPHEVVQQWLLPSLDRCSWDPEEVRALLGSSWVDGGGVGKSLVLVWGLCTILSAPYTPESHPVAILDVAALVVRNAGPTLSLDIPSVGRKVVEFAHGILDLARYHRAVPGVMAALWTVMTSAQPRPGVLTGVHAVFLEACLLTRNFQAGMTVLETPIEDVKSCPLSHIDYLSYHYLGASILIGTKQWARAREMLVAAIAVPGSSVSAMQIEAHKKLVLVNLILTGKETNYPKFVSQQAINAFTAYAGEYAEFAKAYAALDAGKLREVLERKVDVFQRDRNYGLLLSVYEAIPARKVVKMTETYVRMDLETLASKISQGSFTELNTAEAEQLVFQLVTRGEIFARITHEAEGKAYVSFTDDPDTYNSSATIDQIGVGVVKLQEMTDVLAGMEQALSTHESWLKEAIRRDADKVRSQDGGGDMAEGPGINVIRGVGSNWADAGF